MTNSHFEVNYHLCNKALNKLASNLFVHIYSTLTIGLQTKLFLLFLVTFAICENAQSCFPLTFDFFQDELGRQKYLFKIIFLRTITKQLGCQFVLHFNHIRSLSLQACSCDCWLQVLGQMWPSYLSPQFQTKLKFQMFNCF